MTEKTLEGRVILVTGATRGIGFAAAKSLAEAGAHIVALGRTQGALEDLDDIIKNAGSSATLVPMDLKVPDGLDQLAEVIGQRWGRLDGILGNAGILGDLTPANQVEPKIFDDVMAINLTANYRLIRAMDPLMRLSDNARSVFVTSGVSVSRRAFWGAYAASKAALDAFIQCYAKEIEITAMRVNLLNPGGTATRMRAKAVPGEDPETLPKPDDIAPLIVQMMSPDYQENGQIIAFRETEFYSRS